MSGIRRGGAVGAGGQEMWLSRSSNASYGWPAACVVRRSSRRCVDARCLLRGELSCRARRRGCGWRTFHRSHDGVSRLPLTAPLGVQGRTA